MTLRKGQYQSWNIFDFYVLRQLMPPRDDQSSSTSSKSSSPRNSGSILNSSPRSSLKSASGSSFSVNDEPCSCSSIAQRFRNYCKWMGTEHKSSHKARKTFVSAALDGGINLNTVREAVGHQDERTTLQSYLYDRSGDEEVKTKFTDVIDRIHVGWFWVKQYPFYPKWNC